MLETVTLAIPELFVIPVLNEEMKKRRLIKKKELLKR